jgi:fumarate reductase subunit C
MLLAHYIAPRPYMFYYIGDLPAVPLYMACFLLLTRSHQAISTPTLWLLWVAFLNRETVVIAAFHALAFHLAAQPGSWRERWRALAGFNGQLLALSACLAALRLARRPPPELA